MKNLIKLALILTVIGAVAGVYLGYKNMYVPSKQITKPALQAEQALMFRNTLLMAAVNVKYLMGLEKLLLGVPVIGGAEKLNIPETTPIGSWEDLKISPREDITRAFASYIMTKNGPVWAGVLVGKFNPIILGARIRDKLDPHVSYWGAHTIYTIKKPEPRKCTNDVYQVYFSEKFVAVTTGRLMKSLLFRMFSKAKQHPDLQKWRTFRQQQLGSAMLIVPSRKVKGIRNPYMAFGMKTAQKQLSSFESLFLGLGMDFNKLAGFMKLRFDFRYPKKAKSKITGWQKALGDSSRAMESSAPSLYHLYQSIDPQMMDEAFLAKMKVDKESLDNMINIPTEVSNLLGKGLKMNVAGMFDTPNLCKLNRRKKVKRKAAGAASKKAKKKRKKKKARL